MTITIPRDETAEKEAGSASGKPIPAGPYIATIVTTKKDGDTIEVQPAAKEGANAQRSIFNVRFRIESEGYKGRNIFARIPLFTKWAPTGKGTYPNGAPAFLYYQFFEALGFEVKGVDSFQVPDPKTLLGKVVELVVDEKDPDQWNPDGSNEVRFINPATSLPTAAAAAPAADVWATPPATTGPAADVWAPAVPATTPY